MTCLLLFLAVFLSVLLLLPLRRSLLRDLLRPMLLCSNPFVLLLPKLSSSQKDVIETRPL